MVWRTDGQEDGGGVLVVGVVRLGVGHGLAEALQDGGQVGLELLAGLAELLDLGQIVVQEAADQAVQFARAGHVHPHGLVAVLEKDGGLGVFEEDVVAGVAAVELGLDLGVKVVVGVLGLPVAAGHAQGVLDGAVGPIARAGAGAGVKLIDEGELLAVVAAVGVEADGEGAADALLVVGAAEVEETLEVGAVTLDVRVGGHGIRNCTTRPSRPPRYNGPRRMRRQCSERLTVTIARREPRKRLRASSTGRKRPCKGRRGGCWRADRVSRHPNIDYN